MTRDRRFSLIIIMVTSGMNAFVTATVLGLGLLDLRPVSITDVSLLVFSIGCFLLACEVYKLRLRNDGLFAKNIELTESLMNTRRIMRLQADMRKIKATAAELPVVDESVDR